MITVYTDGSAIDNPKGAAGWSWFVDRGRWNFGAIPKGSNQVAEGLALFYALMELPKDEPVTVVTDSKFWVSVLGEDGKTGWRAKWKRLGWKRNTAGDPVANLKLVQSLDKAILSRPAPTKLVWTKGHADNKLNNVADKLCTHASFQMRRGESVVGPGWRNVQAAKLYPIELPEHARKELDGKPTTSAPKTGVAKRKLSPQEIAAKKSEAQQKKSPGIPTAEEKKATSGTRTTQRKSKTPQRKDPRAPGYRQSVLNPKPPRRKQSPPTTQRRPRTKGVPDASIIRSEDDWNADRGSVVTPKSKDEKQYCGSCSRPINLMTGECGGCSW